MMLCVRSIFLPRIDKYGVPDMLCIADYLSMRLLFSGHCKLITSSGAYKYLATAPSVDMLPKIAQTMEVHGAYVPEMQAKQSVSTKDFEEFGRAFCRLSVTQAHLTCSTVD
jgi:hypothetical protein